MSRPDRWRVLECLVALLLLVGYSQKNICAAADSTDKAAKPARAAGAKEVPGSGELVIDLGGGVQMEFVLIRPGSFQMGSDNGASDEQPVHEVKIAKPFYLGKYEVTQEQWKAVMGTDPGVCKGARNPVESVSWEDCQAFLQKLGEKAPARKFRLPAEAEWEYACRAGSSAEYGFGDDPAKLAEYAWYAGNSANKTHPVGEKKPNAWGLYDMHGNVCEWCANWWKHTYRPPARGMVAPDWPTRVLRGGSWQYAAQGCRSARRANVAPGYCLGDLGLRVACDVIPSDGVKPNPEDNAKLPPGNEAAKPAPQAKATEQHRPGELVIDLGGGVKMEFVPIQPGSFLMGSDNGEPDEKPVHKVTITKPFHMGKYEVTQEQWKAVMGTDAFNRSSQSARCPADCVSWEECQAFCQRLAEKAPGHTFRLPTEAEWEYACRAGSTGDYCFGDEAARLPDYAWCPLRSGYHTHPVGEKKPNAWGLYDMHGNVWEWCADWKGSYSDGEQTDPTGPAQGGVRVVRGGSCCSRPALCRSAYRDDAPPVRGHGGAGIVVNTNIGLRVVCVAGSK